MPRPITASLRSPPPPGQESFAAAPSYPRGKPGELTILPPIVAAIRPGAKAIRLGPRSIPKSFRRLNARLRPTPETLTATGSISSSRISCKTSRTRNVRNSSSGRNRTTSGCSNRTPTKPGSNRPSSATSNRPSNCNKNTCSSSSKCSKGNSRRAGSSRRGSLGSVIVSQAPPAVTAQLLPRRPGVQDPAVLTPTIACEMFASLGLLLGPRIRPQREY
jgi:hypothetical protein